MLQVSTLGQALIAAGDLRIQPSSARSFAALLYLASEPGRRFPRASLQAMVFPDLTKASASHSLRQLVYKLRQSGTPIDSRGEEVWVQADKVHTDYDAVIAADRLTADQLTSIQGGFLPGYNPEENSAFAEWLESFRTRLSLELRRSVLRELGRARKVGDWTTVDKAARACLTLDPLNEDATLGLAEAIASFGSKAAAVRILDDYLNEIGSSSADLRVPATLLRRRISERIAYPAYRSQPDLPFVGRDAEMALLADKFQLARRGESQCVVISGEPGIGKSRLAAEFANIAEFDGARVERTAAQPHDVHRPLGAFIELVPRLLQLPGALGCSPESMTALNRLTTHSPANRPEANGLAPDAEVVFYGITRAISDLMEAIAAETTLSIVAEDTHWLDPLSLRVLADLVSARKHRRLFVMLTSRDTSTFADNTRYADRLTAMELKGITIDAATSLIGRAIGEAQDSALSSWMASVSSGNPLFITALTAHYQSTGERFGVPPTLRSLLAKRLRVLDKRAFAVLQMCAVLGKCCTVSRLIAALDMPHIDLLQAVHEAELARLILVDGDRLFIAHALVGEAVVELSTALTLRIAHLKAANVLGSEAPALLGATELWELAEHWVAAGERTRAVEAFRVCADYTMRIGRPREAAIALSRGLDVAPSDAVKGSLGREILLAAAACAEYPIAQKGLSAWREYTQELVTHDDAELAELQTRALMADNVDETFNRLVACATSSDASRSHRFSAAANVFKLVTYDARSSLAERAKALLSGLLDDSIDDRHALEFSLIYHSAVGQLEVARDSARSLRLLSQNWSPRESIAVRQNVGFALWLSGAPGESIECLEECYRDAQQSRLVRCRVMAALMLSFFHLDIDDAAGTNTKQWLQRAENAAQELADNSLENHLVLARTQLALYLGNAAEASRHLRHLRTFPPRYQGEARWVDAMEHRLQQLSGDASLPGVNLDILVREATTLPRKEIADIAIATAAQAMIARGQDTAGRDLLNDYLNGLRNRRAPLDFHLARLLTRLEMVVPDAGGMPIRTAVRG